MIIPHPTIPGKHLDTETGCFPISEWTGECQRGFVRNERFGPNDRVIKPTSRHHESKSQRAEGPERWKRNDPEDSEGMLFDA